MTILDAYLMSRDCAIACGANSRYAETVGRFMTAVALQESNLRNRRQESCVWESNTGGFGFWQVELETGVDCLAYLDGIHFEQNRISIARWVWMDDRACIGWHRIIERTTLGWLLRCNDRLCCLLARVKLLRAHGPLPSEGGAAFDYWLRSYNGEGILKYMSRDNAREQFLTNWRRMEAALPGDEDET